MESRTCRRSEQRSVLAGAEEMFRAGELTDVTLATGNLFYPAHRFMLSLNSTFFRSLFKRLNPHQTPVVFLKDVEPASLELLLQFVYKGEVEVPQHQLQHFLIAANSLGVLGLEECQDNNYVLPAPQPATSAYWNKRTVESEGLKEVSQKKAKTEPTEHIEIKLEVDPTDLTEPSSSSQLTEQSESNTSEGPPPLQPDPMSLLYRHPVSCSWCNEIFDRRANPLPCFKCNLWFHLKCRCRHECE